MQQPLKSYRIYNQYLTQMKETSCDLIFVMKIFFRRKSSKNADVCLVLSIVDIGNGEIINHRKILFFNIKRVVYVETCFYSCNIINKSTTIEQHEAFK